MPNFYGTRLICLIRLACQFVVCQCVCVCLCVSVYLCACLASKLLVESIRIRVDSDPRHPHPTRSGSKSIIQSISEIRIILIRIDPTGLSHSFSECLLVRVQVSVYLCLCENQRNQSNENALIENQW